MSVTRIHPHTAPVIQPGSPEAAEERARRALVERSLLLAYPPAHPLDPRTYGDSPDGALWVHLSCDHDEWPDGISLLSLGELRAVHAEHHLDAPR